MERPLCQPLTLLSIAFAVAASVCHADIIVSHYVTKAAPYGRAVSFSVSGREMGEGSVAAFSRNDLTNGDLVFVYNADFETQGAEISFDDGNSWDVMTREGNRFLYPYRPSDNDRLTVAFIIKDNLRRLFIRRTGSVITYHKIGPTEAIDTLLQTIKADYEGKKAVAFANLFCDNYPKRAALVARLERDFRYFKKIRLTCDVERKTVSPDASTAAWTVHWTREYVTNSRDEDRDEATMIMGFRIERGEWKVTELKGNTIFGSTARKKKQLK